MRNILTEIKKDFYAYKSKYSFDGEYKTCDGSIVASMLVPSYAVVVRYRIYHSLNRSRSRVLRFFSKYLYVRTVKKYGCDIHPCAKIGIPFKIGHASDIVIGPEAELGDNCYIFNGISIGNKYPGKKDEMPRLGDNVIIGTGAKILGDVHIGSNVQIGALSLIISDVAAGTVAVGIPYRPDGK